MDTFSIFLITLLFHSTLNCHSKISLPASDPTISIPSDDLEISLYRNTDKDLKNLQSATEFLREVSKQNYTYHILQFIEKAVEKAGEQYFAEAFKIVGELFGVKIELPFEIKTETEKLIAEFHSLHHSLHHQTHELNAHMDKLNFKDNVVVPFTLTYRALNNFLKKPDLSSKEKLLNMCRQYPPEAVTVHISEHAYDLLTNLYKSTKFDVLLHHAMCSLLLKYFYTAQTIYFFKLGLQYTGSDSAGASEGARADFLRDQNLLQQNIWNASISFSRDFGPYFYSSLNTDIIIPLTKEHASKGNNSQIAEIIYNKLNTKFYGIRFVLFVENKNGFFRGYSFQRGGIRYNGEKTVSVFLSYPNFSERYDNYMTNNTDGYLLENFHGSYFETNINLNSVGIGPEKSYKWFSQSKFSVIAFIF